MTELRKDYLLERYVIIAAGRGKRPHQFTDEKKETSAKKCFFCPGSEDQTPKEIYRVGSANDWKIRVFPNKFAAVNENRDKNDAEIKTHNEFFTFAEGVGNHEVVVETPDHEKQLVDLDVDEMVDVFKTYILRIKELEQKKDVKYVLVFKNHGKDAGTSLVHSHSQIVAYNLVPTIIQQKEKAIAKYAEKAANNNSEPHCAYCKILNIEKTSDRKVFENNNFVCFTPYASRMPYEVLFFPKRHVVSVKYLNDGELYDLCDLLKKVLVKLKEFNASYNFYLHNGTGKEHQFHFHVELLPRITKWAGFELGSETIINTTSPEDAALFYRE
ncbi:galactose-1-phosphate uridylyltransferase [Candidatus Woesearchaeota archaeon]|jgi:UDPglucose--hexose-1-phosphate uridylyltransferase|nr:galactose-1-phosphate uridylyltransferase [Candidatus Woesearchaeota archaeon]MBT5271806.1 galactose-1-phosphate uridylyltransferase [Candidatus Woesearchaeota archaeon]MBT6040675.1 galactose-1-phosphate uridylyltransferase [Candidatus Woesearchaeota archaeon]MBT6336436.1 galactose-1-phosphate uridylyltransferase [Candidatus Woesearchaeota archaeon]MBT7926784.1 galactose-1-phosphate uridylyltransferase [Candidatus Woesearchaeota archaeon]